MTDANSATPEPDAGPMGPMTPEQLAYQRSQRDASRQMARGRRSAYTIVTGTVTALLAIGLAAGGVAEVSIGNAGGAVVTFLVAVLCGWYCYRVWRRRPRPPQRSV